MAVTRIPFYVFSSKVSNASQWQPVLSCSCPYPAIVDRIDTLRLLTWNIWFDKLEQRNRFVAILEKITSLPNLDIIALQEVTPEFLQLARAHPAIQQDWIFTDYQDQEHQKGIDPTWYGNIFLVRRKWIGNIRGWVQKFPTSTMNRFVVLLEIFQGDNSTSVVYLHESKDLADLDSNRECTFRFKRSQRGATTTIPAMSFSSDRSRRAP